VRILSPQIWPYLQNAGLMEHECGGVVAPVFVWPSEVDLAVFRWW